MAIKNWLVHGDCHGDFLWMFDLKDKCVPEETAIIILGDVGFDFYLTNSDIKKKKDIEYKGYYIYWLRGNHEARPSDVEGYQIIFDDNVHGQVYYDPRFPHLRAFLDYGLYDINGYTCLVIGGAYSVDKFWRLKRAGLTEETNNPKKSGWFSNEQLSIEEMQNCERMIQKFTANGFVVDFVLTHTCPTAYQPTDLFLNFIDQSTVDNSMEVWLDKLKFKFRWHIWLFGHYHADRIEVPHVEQFYKDTESLDDIMERWTRFDETGEMEWWIVKGEKYDRFLDYHIRDYCDLV